MLLQALATFRTTRLECFEHLRTLCGQEKIHDKKFRLSHQDGLWMSTQLDSSIFKWMNRASVCSPSQVWFTPSRPYLLSCIPGRACSTLVNRNHGGFRGFQWFSFMPWTSTDQRFPFQGKNGGQWHSSSCQ